MIDNLLKFASDQFRIRHNGLMQVLVTNTAVLICTAFLSFVLKLLGYDTLYRGIETIFCMPSNWSSFIEQPWSILTHLLIQKNFWSIMWGMMLLYTFGTMISEFLGKRHFIPLYIFGGITGASMVLLFYNIFPRFIGINVNIYGIDSCVYAAIAAATTAAPNYPLRLFLFGNVKLKYILWFFLFLAFYGLDEGKAIGICQLGGALGGFIYAKYVLASRFKFSCFFKNLFKSNKKSKISIHDNKRGKNTSTNVDSDQGISDTETSIEEILEKVAKHGYTSLTLEEKKKFFQKN